jgi:O-succinylbenzoic acid--CoA ligase
MVAAIHAVGWLGAVAFPMSARSTIEELMPLLARADHRLGDLPGAIALDAEENSACPPRDWSLSDTRLIVATSGTTGTPKPIPLTCMQLIISAFGSAIRIGHLASDRWINPLPLNHVGGLSILYRCAWYGTTVDLHTSFRPDRINRSIEEGASLVSVVPVMLDRILADRLDDPFPPHVRCILVGGARTPPSLIERCRRIKAPVSLTWGMTEAASQIGTRFPGDLDSAGVPPMPFATVRPDGTGRLHVSGPLVQGEHPTADRGFIADTGEIVIEGRVDNVIISGGENIDPTEIEVVLTEHPAVDAAIVVGVPDETWGQRPIAFLVGRPVETRELRAWCRASLSRFKVPSVFQWVDDFPRNHMGKIVRRKLVGMYQPPQR